MSSVNVLYLVFLRILTDPLLCLKAILKEPAPVIKIKHNGRAMKTECINLRAQGKQAYAAYPVTMAIIDFALSSDSNIADEYVITTSGLAHGAKQQLELWELACTCYFTSKEAPLPLIEAG